jgi:hypothetical protein
MPSHHVQVAVASYCAVMLLCVPGITISTFSTGRRASGLLMELMQRMIGSIPSAEARVVKGNAEQLSIAQTGLQEGQGQSSSSARRKAAAVDTSTFRSYPSNVDGNSHSDRQTHPFTHRRRTGTWTGRSVHVHSLLSTPRHRRLTLPHRSLPTPRGQDHVPSCCIRHHAHHSTLGWSDGHGQQPMVQHA